MNTRTVDARTLWAVLAMEAALALPAISLPTQGDRITGLLGPLLLVLLLPAGYVAVYQYRALRDPSWRLLTAIGLALLTRLIVSVIPDPGPSGVFTWLGRSVVPAAIGIALWWRGGALAVAELSPADVRTEFSIVAVCLVGALALARPFLLPDPVLLGGSVGLFVLGGLIGTTLSRQAAAEVAPPRSGAALAAVSGLVPAGLAVLLVGLLRPELLGTMWFILARAIELILTPIGLFLAWLSSLFPRSSGNAPSLPPPRPVLPPIDPAALADAQERLGWLATALVLLLLFTAAVAALLVARMLLSNWVRDPRELNPAAAPAEVEVERSGAPGDDAVNALGWLMRWLRNRLARRRRSVSRAPGAAVGDA